MSFDMYRAIIMDHYDNPRNFGELKHADARAEKKNPMCGDQIIMAYKTDDHDVITDIKFSGVGCSLAKAAASILTEAVKGKTIDELKHYTDEDFFHDLQAPISPARKKCALVSLQALREAINNKKY